MRQNSLETLGLIGLDYPKINALSDSARPALWRAQGKSLDDWKTFLKLILDYFVRANSAVSDCSEFFHWLGLPGRRTFILSPSTAQGATAQQRYWPRLRNRGRSSRIAILLSHFMGWKLDDADMQSDMNQLLEHAWAALYDMFQSVAGGYVFHLAQHAELVEIKRAWICPYTHRLP